MDDFLIAARRMVSEQLYARRIRDSAVLAAMAAVPRHRFVSPELASKAYSDQALPTTDGQTISQPYIVALMTELLQLGEASRVLEVGAGSGYQAAVLAHMGASVVSVERVPSLAESAQRKLNELGYGDRVKVVVGDGSLGWPGAAPYDRIIVTAAAPHLPKACREQLADGGRIVIPIGSRETQELRTFDRVGHGWFENVYSQCRFVPLIGADAWPSAES